LPCTPFRTTHQFRKTSPPNKQTDTELSPNRQQRRQEVRVLSLTDPPLLTVSRALTSACAHPPTHSLTHSLTHPPTHSPTYTPTHPLTHPPRRISTTASHGLGAP
jgi:hypothetical protein